MELHEARKLKKGDRIENPTGTTYEFVELVDSGKAANDSIVVYTHRDLPDARWWRPVAEMKLPKPTPKFEIGKYKTPAGATFTVEYINGGYAFGDIDGIVAYVSHARVQNYTKI